MKTIRAAVVHELRAPFVIENVLLAAPKEHEVLVKLVATGVCHTDEGCREGVYGTPFPVALGHEGAGIVEETGPGVSEYQPGDHVVISYPSCGRCPSCLEGRPYYCQSQYPLCFGGKYADGGHRITLNGEGVSSFFGQSSFAEYAVADTRNLVKVDPGLDLSYMGPLACGVMTGAGAVMNVLRPGPGDSLAVFGAGSVGLSAIMAAKLLNCHPLIAVDVMEDRLALARELGATHTLNGKEVDAVAELQKLTGGAGVDFALESTGVVPVMRQMTASLRRGGTGGLVARANTLSEPMLLGKRLIGIQMGEAVTGTFVPKLLRLNTLGLFPYEKMISFYPFDEINQAFADTRSGKAIKAVLKF